MNSDVINDYQRRIQDCKVTIEKAKVLNQKYDSLKVSLDSIQSKQQKLYQHCLKLDQLIKLIDQEDAAFRKRRISFLEDKITQELAKIFPTEGFIANIDCDFKRGNGHASLTLKDKYGNERMPEVSEGKLCQYLISFASTVSAVKGLQSTNIYIDEAFGVSSENNLPKIGDIISSTIEEGMQIILISQKADLYGDIPRREIHLKKDYANDVTNVEKICEF